MYDFCQVLLIPNMNGFGFTSLRIGLLSCASSDDLVLLFFFLCCIFGFCWCGGAFQTLPGGTWGALPNFDAWRIAPDSVQVTVQCWGLPYSRQAPSPSPPTPVLSL